MDASVSADGARVVGCGEAPKPCCTFRRMPLDPDDNRSAFEAWDANAAFWDERMGEGNAFFETLVWPAVDRLLATRPGERVLDAACGNGLTSRRLARAGASVVAFDFSPAMIALARERSAGLPIEYRVADATDPDALRALAPERSLDAALCNMALMDVADLSALFAAVARLLRPGGRFVFSITHPAFNNPSVVQMAELEDRDGDLVTTYAVKVPRYMGAFSRCGLAMPGQPVPHPYFHRPLSALLADSFANGMVLDGLEERAFPPDVLPKSSTLSWSGRFAEIPPVFVARLRVLAT
jgi:SAM-dependent methyltransferase